jgi:hypothetical protein
LRKTQRTISPLCRQGRGDLVLDHTEDKLGITALRETALLRDDRDRRRPMDRCAAGRQLTFVSIRVSEHDTGRGGELKNRRAYPPPDASRLQSRSTSEQRLDRLFSDRVYHLRDKSSSLHPPARKPAGSNAGLDQVSDALV